MKLKLKEKVWICTFVGLWLIVSTVSTIHSVEFFKLSNGIILSWALALAFELGAIASLGGLLISRGSKALIWFLFILLTAFQIHCNMYWSWVNAGDLKEWIHLLSLIDEDFDIQKRIFSIISGGILPIIALGFMKSLMDYLNPSKLEEQIPDDSNKEVETIQLDEDAIKEAANIIKEQEEIVKNAVKFNEESEAERIAQYLESEDTFEEHFKEEANNTGISQRELLEAVEEKIEEEAADIEVKKKHKKPFWSKLDPRKTLNLLNTSEDKIQKEVSVEAPQK